MPGGASATSHPLATSAALGAYAYGGNAIDAAIAAAFVLFVVEPDMSHLAGQAHILVRPAKDGVYHHIDAYSFAPASAHATMFRWEPTSTHGNYRFRTQGDENTTGANRLPFQ
jgi:gamma-glutamyltranspeptidase/glutathione hydrolase